MFIYHQAAVSQFRAKVLAPLFADMAKTNFFTGKPLSFDTGAYVKRLDQLAAAQLAYTVNNLYPAGSSASWRYLNDLCGRNKS